MNDQGGIIRNGKHDRFTTIENTVLQDERLSLRARGLHHLLLSYPKDWHINVNQLKSKVPEGRDVIYSCLKELEEAGYLIRRCYNDTKTGQRKWVRTIYESPMPADESTSSPLPDFPGAGSQKPVAPSPDLPDTGSQDTYKVIKDKSISERESFKSRARKKPAADSPKETAIALEPEPELISPEILEPDQPVQRQPIQTSVAKEFSPRGPKVPPAAPQNFATILPFNANSAANFETRWTLSEKPYILQTSPLKFHPALEAAVVMAYGDLYRMANGQANLVKIRSFLRNRSGSVEGLQALDDLWEQAERTATGETTPLDHLAAKATPAKQSSREQFWDSIQL